jgi:hypothetical protein
LVLSGLLRRRSSGCAPAGWLGVVGETAIDRSIHPSMGYWWDRVVLPVRRAWLGVASRFGVRQTGKARGGGSRRF